MKNTIKTTFCALALMTAPALADTQVTLTTVDNSINLSGDLVGFNGNDYVVLSTVGIVSVNADAVTCEGKACDMARQYSLSVASLSQDDDTKTVID